MQKMGLRKMCIVSGELCEIGWFAASFASSPCELAGSLSLRRVHGKKYISSISIPACLPQIKQFN